MAATFSTSRHWISGVVPQGTTDGKRDHRQEYFRRRELSDRRGAANRAAVYYDGVPANLALGNLVNMVPSPDAIAEFRVQTNSNNAEFGRYAGGVINISRGRAPTNFMAAHTNTSGTTS
jgi:hypothetical protein